VTRGGKRVYLGTILGEAMDKYHRLSLGTALPEQPSNDPPVMITAKELANRFLAAQQANWRNPEVTMKCYLDWLGRFLKDHPGFRAADFTVEMFAAWKLSLRRRKYSAESTNHYLNAVRAMYTFAEDTDLLKDVPRLRRVRNELPARLGSRSKPLYTTNDVERLTSVADLQTRLMILLGLNCGFGPKDIQDLTWDDFDGQRVTLPRSKTGICQTFLLWPETLKALNELRLKRRSLIDRMAKRGRPRSDKGHVFMTKFWNPWNKDAVAEQFRKLCKKAGVTCYGFYRLTRWSVTFCWRMRSA
jgi:integrase